MGFTHIANRGPCKFPRCTRTAGIGGYCDPHVTTIKRRTSDGVRTGGRFKLTPEQLSEARRMRSRFVTLNQIARHFGVHESTIREGLKRSSKFT